MRRGFFLFLALFWAMAWLAAPQARAFVPVGQESIAPMLEKTLPGVVNIATSGRVRIEGLPPAFDDPFFRFFFGIPNFPKERLTKSLGSGVVVEARKGYVLTNNHVVEHAEKIEVTLQDGRILEGKLVGADPATDIALVRVSASNLTALPLGDSDNLRVGDFVVAIGNPFGLSQTVTSGIVSALGRTGLGIEGYEDFIQTDAAINRGNSGGALVNLKGELIGINTAILSPGGVNIGIGFAIPVNMARKVAEQLAMYGKVRRGYVGIAMQDLSPDLAKAFKIPAMRGALVSEVTPGSPAERAAIQRGDVVVAVNGAPVRSAAHLRNVVGLTPVGEEVRLEILRDGRPRTLSVRIEKPRRGRAPDEPD